MLLGWVVLGLIVTIQSKNFCATTLILQQSWIKINQPLLEWSTQVTSCLFCWAILCPLITLHDLNTNGASFVWNACSVSDNDITSQTKLNKTRLNIAWETNWMNVSVNTQIADLPENMIDSHTRWIPFQTMAFAGWFKTKRYQAISMHRERNQAPV